MGQIFSLRKTNKESENNIRTKEKKKIRRNCSASDIPRVVVKESAHQRIPRDYVVRSKKIRGSSDWLSSVDTNNNHNNINYPPSSSQSVTKHSHKDNHRELKSVRTSSVDGVLEKPLNNTYANEGYNNHSSSPKSSLRTCHQKNYYHSSKTIYSEPTVQSEPVRRHRHHHHHRRRKSRSTVPHHPPQDFGYDITNVEDFLSKVLLKFSQN